KSATPSASQRYDGESPARLPARLARIQPATRASAVWTRVWAVVAFALGALVVMAASWLSPGGVRGRSERRRTGRRPGRRTGHRTGDPIFQGEGDVFPECSRGVFSPPTLRGRERALQMGGQASST